MGVGLQGGCLLRGCLFWGGGGVCSGGVGVSALGGVCFEGVSAVGVSVLGGVCSWGCLLLGVSAPGAWYPSMH